MIEFYTTALKNLTYLKNYFKHLSLNIHIEKFKLNLLLLKLIF